MVYPFGADLAFPNSDLGPAEVLVLAPAPSPSGSPVSRDKLWATQEGGPCAPTPARIWQAGARSEPFQTPAR